MEASDEDEEYSQFRLKKHQDQANESSEEENSNPDEDPEEGEEGEEEGDEVYIKYKYFYSQEVEKFNQIPDLSDL